MSYSTNADVTIVEWRAGGHRLAYVAGVVNASVALGRSVCLVTTAEAAGSAQFNVHLSECVAAGHIDVQICDRVSTASGLLAELRARGKSTTHLLLPEADRFLVLLVTLRLTNSIPASTVAIAMRPPRLRSVRSLLGRGGLVKLAMLYLLAALLDLRLLDDPLAAGSDRCWTVPLLRRARFRLDDPSLLDGISPTDPPELADVYGQLPIVTMCGSIDERKGLPVVLAAWASHKVNRKCVLLVAGKQSPTVSMQIRSMSPMPPNVVFVDRYLSNAELCSVIDHSRAILVLSELRLSSGTLLACASAGRLVIAAKGTRTARIAVREGFGIQCNLEPTDVAAAILRAVDCVQSPPRIHIPTLSAFGRSVLPASWPEVRG